VPERHRNLQFSTVHTAALDGTRHNLCRFLKQLNPLTYPNEDGFRNSCLTILCCRYLRDNIENLFKDPVFLVES